MKNLILAAVIVGSTFLVATPNAEAGNCKPTHRVAKCAPKVYRVKTVEVKRCRHQKTAYDRCGRRYSFWVTVIAFRDVYSNGQTRNWTRTV